jgi:type III restriction enzyme
MNQGATGLERTRLDNPIINSAYAVPSRHHEFDADGRPTGRILDGRRASEYFVPIPPPKKQGSAAAQMALAFNPPARRETATVVNDLRPIVDLWRSQDYVGLDRRSPSRLLLNHWRADLNPERERRLYFAQIEALETLIYLAEVASEGKRADLRSVFRHIEDANAAFNDGLPRIACKMATGSGKTAVLAMIIAWQTLNRAEVGKSDDRFCDRFLVVAPGITVRDRLRVLEPSATQNVYDQLDLVPAGELRRTLNRARVVVTNYHAFLPRTLVSTTRPITAIGRSRRSSASA